MRGFSSTAEQRAFPQGPEGATAWVGPGRVGDLRAGSCT
eukprot:CAMPEP_0179014734 /NCGR_PEP_ID=MMETSP0796-20121207/2413_1 /TAXON_ID=73915 /ORGANISM="Pyrodinium bahamense, Strain pbaha01" /LENGTH=38 /DNA_ID= /DNA_START= /DNA_END= /DNA_ORIENTATION=